MVPLIFGIVTLQSPNIILLILDPSRVYPILKPSLTVLVEANKDQTQRNNKIVFWPPGSETVFARDARSKQSIWIEMLILDPSRVYLLDPQGYTFKKKHPKVSILKPSLTVLVEDNKDQTQRNNKIVFWPPGSEMFFARDARSKQRIWIEMLILDPSRVYLKNINHPKVSIFKPSLTVLVEANKDQTQRNNKITFWPPGSETVFARDARSKQSIWIEMLILDPSRVYLIDPQGYTLKTTPKSFHS